MAIEEISGYEVHGIEFDREGRLVTKSEAKALEDRVKRTSADVLLLSHGWNNDIPEAWQLYGRLLANLRKQMPSRGLVDGRELLVMAVFWPSKRFADDDLIPGGAASVSNDVDAERALLSDLAELEKLFPAGPNGVPSNELVVLRMLKSLVPHLEDSTGAADDFVRLLRSIMPPTVNEEEPVLDDIFFQADGAHLLFLLGRHFGRQVARGGAAGGAELDPRLGPGGAAGLGNLFRGLRNGARNALNLFTYYEMKARAGQVGATGVRDVVRSLQTAGSTVHLAGHSFGGRLVSALVGAPQGQALDQPVGSMTLLQAAFSHWAFAPRYDGERDGLFVPAFSSNRVRGATVVTHTINDRAVGLAYPIASRLKNQIASGLGDAEDPYGAIGRNGAQRSNHFVNGEVNSLLGVDTPYPMLARGKIHNLEASNFIPDHGTVYGPEVAHALLAAMRSA